jgi:hypothetical protein
MWHAGELDKGYGVVGQQMPKQISGPTEYRNKGGQLGQSIDPEAFQQYYNSLDPKRKQIFEALQPDDQVRVMQGTFK